MNILDTLSNASPAVLMVFFVVLALVYSLARDLIQAFSRKTSTAPIAEAFKNAFTDVPGLLALAIVLTFIAFLLTKTEVPGVLENVLWLVLGYYFARAVPAKKPSREEAAETLL